MAYLEKSKLFNSPKFDSRIKSANVQKSERWLGFFTGPMLIYMAYFTMSGTYLNQFYVDVLKLGGVAGGAFLALLPILSKIFDAATNLIMGQIIDRTKTRQGKARPWLMIAGPLVAITGIMLYAIPQASLTVQAIWVAVSYNLYFAFAFTIYNMSQAMMVPLSTRNVKQRDSLALFSQMGMNMIPGSVIYIIVPLFLLPYMGVNPSRWASVMSIISIIVLAGTLLQYYFTKERVSEDENVAEVKTASLGAQFKACFSNKYWVFFILLVLAHQLQNNLYSASSVFYANWVLGTYNDGTTLTLLNAVGQAPLGLGVFLLWPIAKKFGKRRTMVGGALIAAAGCFAVAAASTNFGAVLGAMAIRSVGMLPTYLMASFMADAMDYVEWKEGFRCDGLTATFHSVMITVMGGIATSLFNAGLSANGYVPPTADGSWVVQNAATQSWIITCVAVIPGVCFILMALFSFLSKIEPLMPQISKDITARHRAEAEARGEAYYSPEEKAAMEQKRNDEIAEQNRLKELREKCAKKGLNFDEEEAKYQAKLTEKKAKAAAKAKKQK